MDCAVCQKPAGNKCSACKNVAYCSVECQKKDWKVHKICCSSVKSYTIKKNEDGTEYFEAARDLPVGTIIFDETPIFQIPFNESDIKCCLSCSLPIQKGAKYQNCSKCTWPICSSLCEQLPIHRDNECQFLTSSKIKWDLKLEGNLSIPIGSRGLMIKKNNKELWDYLQSRGLDDEMKKKGKRDDEQLTDFVLKLEKRTNVKETQLQEIVLLGATLFSLSNKKGFCRALDEDATITPNSHAGNSILEFNRSENPRIRGYYLCKIAGKMTHSCSPNTNWHIGDYPDFKFRLRTIVPVKKGEKLTLSRLNGDLNEINGTIPRSEYLRRTLDFFCKCPRCSSPTELGTYFSAIRCDSCFPVLQAQDKEKKENKSKSAATAKVDDDVNSGYFLPVDPLAYEKDGHFYLWKCNRCQKIAPYSKFLIKIMDVTKEVKVLAAQGLDFPVDTAQQLIEKYEGNFLHPNHYLLHQAHFKILDCLRDQMCRLSWNPDTFGKTPPDYLEQVAKLEDAGRMFEFLLKTVDKILPGVSCAKVRMLRMMIVFKTGVCSPIFWCIRYKPKPEFRISRASALQEITQRKEQVRMFLDYFKDDLPTHRGQDKCHGYDFWKPHLELLEKLENGFSQNTSK